jgi:hypothetical protein
VYLPGIPINSAVSKMPSYEEKMEAAALSDAKEQEIKDKKRREREAAEDKKNNKPLPVNPSKIFVRCPHCARSVR